LPKIGTMEKQS